MVTNKSPWYSLVFYGLEFLGRYYSSYRGFVVDNLDLDGMNRIKVTVPVLNSYDRTGVWAYPKGNWGGKNYGVNFLPQKGDMVWVEFEHGDQNYPVWSFASYGENEIPEEFNSPNKYGFKTPAGSIILINDVEGEEEILIKHSNSNEYIQLLKDNATLEAKNIVLEGTTINLGEKGEEKALMGDTTKEKIDDLASAVEDLIKALTSHTHPAPNTPSVDFPGTSAAITSKLVSIKTTLVDILSNKVKIDK